jgi:hypothetical protein
MWPAAITHSCPHPAVVAKLLERSTCRVAASDYLGDFFPERIGKDDFMWGRDAFKREVPRKHWDFCLCMNEVRDKPLHQHG